MFDVKGIGKLAYYDRFGTFQCYLPVYSTLV